MFCTIFVIIFHDKTHILFNIFIFMSCLRALLAIIFPPLAVADKGCGSFSIVLILTILGWVPGVIAALIILNKQEIPQ